MSSRQRAKPLAVSALRRHSAAMLAPRKGYLGTLAGFLLLFVLDRIAKPVLDVEVQDFWKDNAHPLVRDRAASWGAAMLEWIGPFWSGVGSAFAVMLCVEMVFAWRRSRLRGKEMLTPVEPPTGTKASRSLVRLRFSGHTEQPEEIDKENVAFWFVYWSQEFKMESPEGKPVFYLPPTWVAFVLYEKPVDYKQLAVNFSGGRPDRWQVRQCSPMAAIVTMDSPMPACEMEIITRI